MADMHICKIGMVWCSYRDKLDELCTCIACMPNTIYISAHLTCTRKCCCLTIILQVINNEVGCRDPLKKVIHHQKY